MSKSRIVFTILGCGSSPGVPRIGNDWGACDPNNPKNERLRCSLLIEKFNENNDVTRVLIDTSPDMRQQLLRENVDTLSGVLFTHPHADHIHGIDDLRAFWIMERGALVDTYADAPTSERLHEAFGYCYKTPEGSSYPPILTDHRIEPYEPVTIDGPAGPITVLPYEQTHGDIVSLGFRIENFAYSSDVNALSDQAFDALDGVDIWIVDALRYKPHPSHFSVDEALEAAGRVKARRTILTHMHIDLDYETLKAKLPKDVEPAYDGMKIEISG
ncbi:MAG: MBL fold metallo-hydrolase [Hyphomicrobiales bacterium]